LDPDRPATKQVIESVEKQIAKNSGTTANLEIGKPKNLGDFNNSANVYSILILSSVKLEAGDQGLDRMILAGASLVHVKSRILFVNCYRTYKSDADVETIKESVNKWVKGIITANEAN
jgi:hypothetical protein